MKKPIISIVHNPTPHIVIDNFFENFDLISSWAREIYPHAMQGSHGGAQYPGLHRRELYLAQKPDITNFLVELTMNEFWTPQKRKWWDTMPMPFAMLNNTTFSDLLLGFYGQGDQYSLHHDLGFITCVMYLHHEKNFQGGEFILTNRKMYHSFHEKEEEVLIESLPNRLVIFPSCYLHGVRPIIVPEGKEQELDHMRIALSYFLSFKIHA